MVVAMAVLGDIMIDVALLDVDFSHLYLGMVCVVLPYFTFLLNEIIFDSLRKWVECLTRSHRPTTSIPYLVFPTVLLQPTCREFPEHKILITNAGCCRRIILCSVYNECFVLFMVLWFSLIGLRCYCREETM